MKRSLVWWTLAWMAALAGWGGLAGATSAAERAERDAIQVRAPAQASPSSVYDVTISGYARRRARAYVFIDYTGCARSFEVERRRAGDESDVYSVKKGDFAETSGWRSPTAGEDHACAYLLAPGSDTVLAAAHQTYRIR
jgi:hypothetical protein